jgi:hypothetical protein
LGRLKKEKSFPVSFTSGGTEFVFFTIDDLGGNQSAPRVCFKPVTEFVITVTVFEQQGNRNRL